MSIHALCVVKNEADIIEQTLRAAVRWCDWIYVLDNGSRDGTWEKVQALAKELPAVVPFGQDARPFDDGIRNVLFRRYRRCAQPGDWWCVLDADEFYIDDPRRFLERVPRRYDTVWYALYVYLFTDVDRRAWEADPRRFDDHVPIEQRLRHYVVGEYSEARFFRHASGLTHLPADRPGLVYPCRIRLKHFAYRSPPQIAARLETRREPMLRGEFLHEKRANWVPDGVIVPGPATLGDLPQSWDERVVASAHCHEDSGDGRYAAETAWTPPRTPLWPLARRVLRRLIA